MTTSEGSGQPRPARGMQAQASLVNAPTVGDLKRAGRRLWAHCMECGHERALDLAHVSLADAETVPTVGQRLKCSGCGSKRIYTCPESPREPGGEG